MPFYNRNGSCKTFDQHKKHNLSMQKFQKLSRAEMKRIAGGTISSCTANCGNVNGKPVTVTCTGKNCIATNFNGCSTDEITVPCPDVEN